MPGGRRSSVHEDLLKKLDEEVEEVREENVSMAELLRRARAKDRPSPAREPDPPRDAERARARS